MAISDSGHQYRDLVASLQAGNISRRQFMARSAALGIGTGMALFIANAASTLASGGSTRNGFAIYQDASATPGATGGPPAVGMEGLTRGAGPELRMVQWQGATMLNAHRSTGTKDFLCADIINEPLMRYLPDGSLYANLAADVPSVEAGTLAEDLSSATFKLKEGVVWSDGTPFTAKDVRFTWQWITTEANNTVSIEQWRTIKDVEVVDDLTAKVTFNAPSAAWFDPFTGGNNGPILPSHLFGDDPANAFPEWDTAPVGTGPYKLESFEVGTMFTAVPNENYREPNKPYFSRVIIIGGGEAASAAIAVLQTGESDYAWNLQVEPEVLAAMITEDGPGDLEVALGTSLERIHINFSDPNKEVNGQRSEKNTPHPFFTDPAVRQAFNKAVPRQVIADEFYGNGQVATPNILAGVPAFTSPNTTWEYNLDAANKILDDAGWAMDGDTRKKDGVELSISYATSINQVRQKTQQVVKLALNAIGVQVKLEQVNATSFFDSGVGNDQNINHFYWDIDMYTNNATSVVPIDFLADWYAGPDGGNIAQAENDWSGTNRQRWVNPDFDAKFDALKASTDLETAFGLCIEMNDILINDVAVIPEVNRAADVYAISRKLQKENIALGFGLEYNYWNIANWALTAEALKEQQG
jgi:peptide/nickel transport system substrate-binding protein